MATTTAIPNLPQATTAFRQLLQSGIELSDTLERGQANRPITDQFNFLSSENFVQPLCLGLISVDAAARAAALAFLCGDQYRVWSIAPLSTAGHLEITFQERGFAIERSDGSKIEFDQIEPFLEALRESDMNRKNGSENWLAAIRLRLSQGVVTQGLRIISPQPLDQIDLGKLVSDLSTATNTLIFAASSEWRPTAATSSAVAELTSSNDLSLPFILDARPEGMVGGWWEDRSLLRSTIVMTPINLAGADEASFQPALLSDTADPVRQALDLSQMIRDLRVAIGLICDRQESDTRRIASIQLRCVREQRALDEGGKSQDLRFELDRIRAEFQDELGKLTVGLSEANRKAALPDGPLNITVRKACESLTQEDLEQETMPKVIRLSVSGKFTAGVKTEIREALRRRFKDDLVMLRDALEIMRENLERQLLAIGQIGVSVQMQIPDERAIWSAVDPLIRIDLQYKAELPRRTFVHRIMEGRRPVATILMMLSVFSGLGAMVRHSVLFIVGVPILFLFGVAQTFRTFKQEDVERMAKEVEHCQEGVETELQKIVTEVQREKLSRLSGGVAAILKETNRQIDAAGREISESRIEEADQMKSEIKLRLRSLEQRAKLLQAQAPRVAKLLQSCAEMEAAAKKALVEAAKAAKVGVA